MNYVFSHSITPIPAQLSEVIHFPATPMQVLARRKEKDRSSPDLMSVWRCCDFVCPIAVSVKAMPTSGTQGEDEELLRRKGCVALPVWLSHAHCGQPGNINQKPSLPWWANNKEWASQLLLTEQQGERNKNLQVKSIQPHSFSHFPPSPRKVNATCFVFLKISLVNIMRPLTVTSSQHPTVIPTIQQHPHNSKELENTSSAENTNINVQNKHIWCIRAATKSLQRLQGKHLFVEKSKLGRHNELVRHGSASGDSEGN